MTGHTHRHLLLGVLPALILFTTFALPASRADSEEDRIAVSELIEQLGSTSKHVRDNAFAALSSRGEEARRELDRAAGTKDPIVRDSVQRLLDRLDDDSTGRLRLKRPADDTEQLKRPPMPRMPLFRPDASEEGDAEEWREWNRRLEHWNEEVDRWFNEMLGGRMPDPGGLARIPFDESGSRFQTYRAGDGTSARYDMEVDQDGKVTVRVERDDNGKKSEQTFEAESMAAFRRDYPEIAREMGVAEQAFDWSLEAFRTPPQGMFPGRLQQFGGLRRAGGPRLGVQARALLADDPLRSHVSLDPGIGLLVVEVIPESLAEELGMRRHDIIVKIGVSPIGQVSDVTDALRQVDLETIEVTVVRAGAARILRRGV